MRINVFEINDVNLKLTMCKIYRNHVWFKINVMFVGLKAKHYN